MLLSRVVKDTPIGTNLGLFRVLSMVLCGRLLASRGAIFPGLSEQGLPDALVRRSWAALAYGKWNVEDLIKALQTLVQEEGVWRAHTHEGYRPVACDLVGFFRPRLKECPTKHFLSSAGKALPAIVLGLVVSVGSVKGQRLPVLRALVRAKPQDPTQTTLMADTLAVAAKVLKPDEVLVCDRGFKVQALQEAEVPQWLVRGQKNFTARRAYLPEGKGVGRPTEYGDIVRPLERTRKDKRIAATPPDRTLAWQEDEHILRADFFDDLVSSFAKPGALVFHCIVIHDPHYLEPLLMLSALKLSAPAARNLYRDRWPIEQVPLVAKQMLGAARQFVFAPETRQRWPELCLLAGSILSYVAATQPPTKSGFWDRSPKPTSGRLRRALAASHFQELPDLWPRLRERPACTQHLPKGILGHRRSPRASAPAHSAPVGT
jgi:hypothetical protein